MTPRHNHRLSLAAPYFLRPGLLIAFEGAPGAGKTTQFQRLQHAQAVSTARLFEGDPLFVPDGGPWSAAARVRTALTALADGRTVFADGWDNSARPADLLLLFPRSLDGQRCSWPWPGVPAERIVPLPEGHEGEVGLALWTALAGRKIYAACSCQVGVVA